MSDERTPVAQSGRPRTDHEPMQGGDLPAPGESKSLSVSEAASLLAKRRYENSQTDSGKEQPVDDVAPEEEIAPDDEQPEEDSDVEDGQSDGEEGEYEEEGALDDADSDEEQTAEDEAGPLELGDEDVVMIDGVEMTLQDIRDNTIAQDDYTRKTQAIAETREVLKQREQLVGMRLGQMEASLTANLKQFESLDWQGLAAQDPERYNALRAQHDAAKQHLMGVQQQTQEFFSQIKAMEEQAQKQAAGRAASELKRRIPGWNNGMYYSLVDYASSVGFDRGEVLKYVDPNVFEILRKAKLYDEAQKSAGKTKKVVRASAKRNLRAKAPTGRARPSREKQAVAEAQKRAKESATTDDAVKLLQARRKAGLLSK